MCEDSSTIESPLQSESGLYFISTRANIALSHLKDVCHPFDLEKAISYKSSQAAKEYLYSRYLLRKTLGLTAASAPLLKNSHGSILWPRPYKGSLSHKAGFCVCLIGKGSFNVGVDIEQFRVSAHVVRKVSCSAELERWYKYTSLLQAQDRKFLNAAIFSIKESAFKYLSPLNSSQKRLSFEEIEILSLDLNGGRFEVSCKHLGQLISLFGRVFWVFLEKKKKTPYFVLSFINKPHVLKQ